MPSDTGAISLLLLAAALLAGILGISERVQSQPVSKEASQPLHYADWQEPSQ